MIGTSIRTVDVGLGETTITNDVSVVLTCNGIGSCIAICVYDPQIKMGGMANLFLSACPEKDASETMPSNYINTGTPLLIERMLKQGSQKENLIVKIAGGATVLPVPVGSRLDIGQKNIAEVRAALVRENLEVCAADVGGNYGRSVQFHIDCGRVTIKSLRGQITNL
jgi:chemotaxis protein CheD